MFVLPLVGGPIKAAATAAKAANVASKAAKASKATRLTKVAKSAKTAAKAAGAKVAEDVTTPVLYGVLTRPTIGTAGRGVLASDENVYNMFGTTKEQVDSLR
jgi:enhancing lycopene biosynthesis protein 2